MTLAKDILYEKTVSLIKVMYQKTNFNNEKLEELYSNLSRENVHETSKLLHDMLDIANKKCEADFMNIAMYLSLAAGASFLLSYCACKIYGKTKITQHSRLLSYQLGIAGFVIFVVFSAFRKI